MNPRGVFKMRPRWRSGRGIGFAVAMLLAQSVGAAVMMIDFGPTTVSLGSRLNSPYHTENPTFTGTSWNKVQTADSSSLVWSDGSAAAGVSLNLGATSSDSATLINLATTPSGNSALGNKINTGVYADTSVGKDGIFMGTGAAQVRYVGLQIGGLAAGQYQIYMMGRNTSTDSNVGDQNFFYGVSGSSGNFDAAGYSYLTVSYPNGASSVSSWVQEGSAGENYVKFTVSLAAGQYLNLAVRGGGSGTERRGFLNAIEIAQVQVPEPSSLLMLLIGFAGVNRYRRGLQLRRQAFAADFPDARIY